MVNLVQQVHYLINYYYIIINLSIGQYSYNGNCVILCPVGYFVSAAVAFRGLCVACSSSTN